jgi:hypothetical protein
MEAKRKKFGMEMTKDLHDTIKSAAAKRGMKLYEATQQAFLAWLGDEEAEPAFRGKRSEAHELLEEILSHGEPEAGWITGNLITFHGKLKSNGVIRSIGTRRRSGKKGEGSGSSEIAVG